LILTVHDLIYFRFPTPPAKLSFLTRAIWRAYHLSFWPQRWLLKSTDALVTVSQTTALDLSRTRMYPGEIAVIPNAVSDAFLAPRSTHKSGAVSKHRLIYMGTFMGYKDVETLVRASALVSNSELHLVSAIEPARQRQLQDLANLCGARVVFQDGMTDSAYIELLDSASLVVSASLAEGFGIPVLEGFARAVPAVLSDIPAFREVAGGAALFFAPGNADACAAAIAVALEQRESLSASAQRRVEEFSWAESAKRLIALFERLS
jgi:glycosyltransferase involved in cell wall biosynthesis